jgi:hypothetical protein
MTHGIIAQEVGELFPEMVVFNNPRPRPVLSITAPPENNIAFHTGQSEMLKITENGFYVRGVKIEADKNEAAAVYRAFKQFLTHHALTKDY